MRFSLLALPALALAAAVPEAAPATTEAPSATTDGPATYSNTSSALKSALSEMDAKSPAPAEATSSHNPVPVSGSPASTGVAKPTGIVTTTKKAGKPKTTTTTTKKTKKPKTTTTTTTKKKGKATPAPKKAVSKRQNIANCGAMQKPSDYTYTPSANFANESAVLTNYYTDATFNAASKAGVAPTSAYKWVWQGFYASANAIWYQGFTTLNTYNVSACAAICDQQNGCKSFNIFYERTPTLNPAPACPKPSAYTVIKCTFWEDTFKPSHAVNYGEWRQSFPIIVAGSNGYTKGT